MHSPEGTRYRATVHYDGSAFAGWQVQPEVRTVQGDIEAALRRIGIPARVHGAGRTDAGVHAAGQEFSFDAPQGWTATELSRALDALLKSDTWIERLVETRPDFHPRFHATGRRYEYFDSLEKFREFEQRGIRSLELAAPIVEKYRLPLAVEGDLLSRFLALLQILRQVGLCLQFGWA